MNRLYFVACYSHVLNEWERRILTAPDPETAAKECEYAEWKARRVQFICETPDEVSVEI